MKIRLLPPTSPDYYSFNVLLTELLLIYNQASDRPAGCINWTGTISATSQNMPLCITTVSIFPSGFALPTTSATHTGKRLQYTLSRQVKNK